MPSRKVKIQYNRARKHLPLEGNKLLNESMITFQEPIYPKNKVCSALSLAENQSICPIKENNQRLSFKRSFRDQ